MVYLAMALALFADDDYEEVAVWLTPTLVSWGCWDSQWAAPTSGGITQARQRPGYEPVRDLFAAVAGPVADQLTRGAFLADWWLMAIDGFEWDAPATKENAAAFGYAGAGTAPTYASSSAPATTPTGSRDQPTQASATTGRPRSGSRIPS